MMKLLNRKEIFVKILAVLFCGAMLVGAFTLPVFSEGQGEWPCQLYLVYLGDGVWDVDCQGNSGNCTCTIFVYEAP